MEKRRERIGLSLLLVLALVSVSNATLSMNLSGSSMDIGGAAIVITISSDVSTNATWGVYLDPTSEYTAGNAQLQNATALPSAGSGRSVTGADPGPGHDYASGGGGRAAGDWSTVEFVGLAVGTYTIDLYVPAGGGQTATADIDVVPEPATIALLGLGGLFLTRRRRR